LLRSGASAVLLSARDAGPRAVRRSASLARLSADQLVTWGVLYYAYSVLSAPIAEDLQVSTRFVAGAFSGTLLVSCLLAPRVGRALDRRGARPLLVAGAIVGSVALGALATVRHEIPLLLAFAALGVAQSLSLYEPAFRAVVDWFPIERERSAALLVLTSVAGFASTVFLPLTAVLLDGFGWRVTVLVLASVVAVVTIPLRLALPARIHAAPEPDTSSRITLDRAPAAASVLAAAFGLHSFASTGATVCLVWQLVEKGESLRTAAVIAGLAGASQVPGRLLLSPLARVVRSEIRLPLLLFVQAAALAAIAVGSGPALAVAIFFFGAANGIVTLERAAVVVEWFGRESFGARSGQIASLAWLARAAAPFSVELLHGTTRYAGVFGLLAVVLASGGAAACAANRLRAAGARSRQST
jgi:predicted MFS family arabinose efflux permease